MNKVNPEEFKRLVLEGKSLSEIARYFNVCLHTARYWERKLGLKAKRKFPMQKVDPDKLRELYLKDMRIREIAQYFGCSKRTIYRWIERLDLPKKRIGIARGFKWQIKVDPEKFKELYLQGMKHKDIAEYFGCHPKQVCYWIKKLNLPKRRICKKRCPKIDRAKFKELYLRGYSYEQLAKIFNSTVDTMRVLRYRLGLPKRKRRGIKSAIIEIVEKHGFISREDLAKELNYRTDSLGLPILNLILSGRIHRMKFQSCGRRKNLLSRTLQRAGLSGRTFYYLDEDKFAQFIAEQLIMNLDDYRDFHQKIRALKLALRNTLPMNLYNAVQKYL